METENTDRVSALEAIQNVAEIANAIAAFVCGHRRILVEGGFDPDLADQMAAAIHATMLGLAQSLEDDEENTHTLEFLIGREEDEDDE